jgi:nucleolar protein 4
MESMNATEHAGRTIAVDWSIPKTQYREVEEKEAAAIQATAVENEDTEMKEASEDEEENSEDDEEKEEEENSDNEGDEDSDNEDDDEDDFEAKKASKKTGPTSEDGTTLFIRNLLFESTEEDLKQL